MTLNPQASTTVRRLDIAEFRGIRRLAKPLELGGFNVLIGRNNVGKTAILEALYLLAMPYGAYKTPIYGTNTASFLAKIHGDARSLVYGYAGKAVLSYELTGVPQLGRAEVRIEVVGSSVHTVLLNSREAYYDDYVAFLKSLGVSLERDVLAFYIPNNTTAYSMIRDHVLKDDVWSWIEKEGLHRRAVKDVLEPAVYDKFTEVLIRRDRLCVRKEVSEEVGPLYVDVDSLGEGVKRVLLTYLAVEYLRPRIVLWDDVEVAVHPSLLESALKWLAGRGGQVVISTHSIDVLHVLTLVKPGDARVIALRKTPYDEVDYRVFTVDEVEELLGGGVDVRKVIDELEL